MHKIVKYFDLIGIVSKKIPLSWASDKYPLGYLPTALLFLVLLFSGCSSTKYLQEDQTFLKQNVIRLPKDYADEDKLIIKFELNNLIKQKPNNKTFIGVNKRWYYYKKDSKWWGWLKNRGEEPAIFKESLAEQSVELIRNYFFKKGYFNVQVAYEDELDRTQKFTKVNYDIKPNKRYMLDSVYILSEDATIQPICNDIEKEISLRKGNPADSRLYEESVNTIQNRMIKLGYAAFSSTYILPLEIDTLGKKYIGKIVIQAPGDTSGHHHVHNISKIKIYPNYKQVDIESETDTLINGYHFVMQNREKIGIKIPSLLNNIYFKSGEKYDRTLIEKTAAKLNTLDIYKFSNVRSKIVPDNKVEIDILLKPSKKYEYEFIAEGFLGNNSITNFQIGSLLSLNFRNRNVFRSADVISGTIEGGIELNQIEKSKYNLSYNFKFLTQYSNPNFSDYLYLWHGLKEIPIFKNFYATLKDNSYTRFTFGYDLIDQLNINLFRNNQLNLQYGYNINFGKNSRVLLNHFGIDLIYPKYSVSFDTTIIQKNPFLQRSFGRQFYSGILVRNLDYYYSKPLNAFGESNSVRVSSEFCGAEAEVLKRWIPLYLGDSNDKANRMEISRFAKVETEYRYNHIFNKNQSFAFRTILGLAVPFGLSQTVPYNKQFFIGGPNSIRAWRIRELGPGSYRKVKDNIANFQTGDLKFEVNGEYRFSMLRFSKYNFEGALFVDAGNVWLLTEDQSREGAKISNNFWKEIAVGTGFGARFDFNITLIRLDMGLKLFDPNPDAYVWLKQKDPFRKFGISDITFNLAVSYPF